MSAQRITLRISQITIDGGRHDKRIIAQAIERELVRRLSEPGVVEMLGGARWAARIDGGRVRPQGSGSAALARAVAHATMGALVR